MFILKRDSFSCQLCGQEGGALEAHHILRKFDRPDLTLDTKNGITLCKYCHRVIVTGKEKFFVYIFTRLLELREMK